MSVVLPAPWSGLASHARSLDLWPILERLGGPAAAAAAPLEAWLGAGLPARLAEALTEPAWATSGVHAAHEAWPAVLSGAPGGPVAFAYEGNLSLLRRPMVALIGARACTAYGRTWAAQLAAAVVEAGGVVVSGLAPGIDATAHEAAAGATVAVLGQALDAPMARWQAELRRRLVAQGGLVVSEFRPGTHADRSTFPIRNRIVAGLSRAVVVVEAAHRSGTKNTAAHALRFGREVLAVPGPLGAEASEGCLDLIEEGAGVVRGPASVIEAAGLVPAVRPGSAVPDSLLHHLGNAQTAEQVSRVAGAPLPLVLGRLAELELRGAVVRLPGRRYVRRAP